MPIVSEFTKMMEPSPISKALELITLRAWRRIPVTSSGLARWLVESEATPETASSSRPRLAIDFAHAEYCESRRGTDLQRGDGAQPRATEALPSSGHAIAPPSWGRQPRPT
mmetsp:Transcript_56979/g.177191  ORF Transcript_56979/g.177191 Transcript_56979/m.177191 type:complete len:111 (+) Transcript_56979:419-751(+)